MIKIKITDTSRKIHEIEIEDNSLGRHIADILAERLHSGRSSNLIWNLDVSEINPEPYVFRDT